MLSEVKRVSPLLDDLMIGDAISEHHGVRCYPAMHGDTEDKYIVKVISHPSTEAKLDALLLTGAYPDVASALRYFKELSDGVLEEVDILRQLSELEGFLPYDAYQQELYEDEKCVEVYLLGSYKRSLSRQLSTAPLTHLGAINLGLDLCAALTVARRAGYLYVDLKPDNIYITAEGEYKIGDIGFIRLDGLKYASLPEMYHSEYTAPEVCDAYSELNDTLDVYAVGLILYQAYNGGQFPNKTDAELQAPVYADYEMSEIILKALAVSPEDRWQSPVEIGQALVSYMQRNGANDTPIISPAAEQEEPAYEEPEGIYIADKAAADTEEDTAVVETAEQDSEEVLEETEPQEDMATDDPIDDEDFENLSFLDDVYADETDLPEDALTYDQLSEDLTEILEQADDLASHDVPDGVVIAPDPIDVLVPEPIAEDEATSDAEDGTVEDDGQDTKTPPKKSHLLRNCVIILTVFAVLTFGVFLFLQYYFVPIDSIRLEGSEDSLTVHVSTTIDESLLEVICSDPHGNHLTAPVKNGVAVFDDLVPNTAYNVRVTISGFHKITGDASSAYSTPVQTSILQFSGVTGATAGSVILGFNIEGPDSTQWTITYSAEDEETKSVTFPSHMFTLDGLTVGKEYTFRLEPVDELYLSGEQEIKVVASELLFAQNLHVSSLQDGKLVANWTAPAGAEVASWTVRCYNDSGYDQTLVVDNTTATFADIDEKEAYTLEVIAAGMSVSQRVFVDENSTILSDFKVTEDRNTLSITWSSNKNVPESGWLLRYSVDGHAIPTPIYCSENAAIIRPVVPGATYSITIEGAGGAIAIGTPYSYTTKKAEEFTSSYGGNVVTAQNITFKMCITPPYANWNRYAVHDSDYTTTFTPGQSASFVLHVDTAYGYSYDEMTILFVIRNEEGTPVSISSTTESWTGLWYWYYGELDVPAIPQEPGNYTIDIYFDGALAGSESFTITD